MSLTSLLSVSSGTGSPPGPGSAQTPAQRIASLRSQQSQLDRQIAATKLDKKLSCSEIDSEVGSLKAQQAQLEAQLQRVESQQRQPDSPAQPNDGSRIHVIA